MFGPGTAAKIFSRRYISLRARGLIDRSELSQDERRYADIRPNDGLGADDPEYSTCDMQSPYDPDADIRKDSKCCDKLKGANDNGKRR